MLAPGGNVIRDANGDGAPEGILAQTFAPGDPTDFGYYFYAGTSQAAAEVSGVVASMLALHPTLDLDAVRGILTESTTPLGEGLLSTDGGRGLLRADVALAAAAAGDVRASERKHFNANVVVTLHDTVADTKARARVEVIDSATGEPAPGVTVYGLYTGAAFGAASAVTDASGVADLWSETLSGNLIVAFQVDAVGSGAGATATFDRPRGFLRIESRSLERLSTFAVTVAEAGGTGIGTSPSLQVTSGLDAAVAQSTPITVALDALLFPETGYRPTLLLPNFSWGLSTAPMAVAVDEDWFLTAFPDAGDRRAISYGAGTAEFPLAFDDSSFPVALPAPPEALPSVPLLVLTFSSGTGIGTSPSIWNTVANGIGTSPSGEPEEPAAEGTGIGTSPSIVVARVLVDRLYSNLDPVVARDFERLLHGVLAYGTGIGTSPSWQLNGPWSFPPLVFNGISTLGTKYSSFTSMGTLSAPAASYGSTLSVASMPVAPVSPASDGPGVGVVLLP